MGPGKTTEIGDHKSKMGLGDLKGAQGLKEGLGPRRARGPQWGLGTLIGPRHHYGA